MQEAARRELGWPDPAPIDAALARGRAALEGLGSFEAADLIRVERKAAMSAIDVVSDANVVLKWFHAEGEEEVSEARDLLAAHRSRDLGVAILDLT